MPEDAGASLIFRKIKVSRAPVGGRIIDGIADGCKIATLPIVQQTGGATIIFACHQRAGRWQ